MAAVTRNPIRAEPVYGAGAKAESDRLRAVLNRLHAWGECFVKDTPITAETLWREFPAAVKVAAVTLGKVRVESR